MAGSLAREFQISGCCEACGRPFENLASKHGVVLSFNSISCKGVTVILTGREVDVLRILLKASPAIVTKEHLFLSVWSVEQDMKILEVYMCKIRKKLRHFPITIDTSWGRGYKLVVV